MPEYHELAPRILFLKKPNLEPNNHSCISEASPGACQNSMVDFEGFCQCHPDYQTQKGPYAHSNYES